MSYENLHGGFITDNNTGLPTRKTININLTDVNGYRPKNKKCFCYPYNVLFLTNNSGSRVELKPELFDTLTENDNEVNILYYSVVGANPSIFAYPQNYGGHAQFYEMGVSFNNFPLIPYNIDTFKQWYALHKNECGVQTVKAVTGLFTSVGSMALGIGSANLTSGVNREVLNASNVSNRGIAVYNRNEYNNDVNVLNSALGAVSGIEDFAQYIAHRTDQQRQPNSISSLPQGNEQLYSGSAGIYLSQCQIRLEYVEMIDDFFTRFGYQVNTTKAITITNRENFDYVQTTDCNITGDIPQEDIEELEAIFDRGVTIWHNENTYGDWNVSNRGWGDIS